MTITINPINDNTPIITASQSFNVDEDAVNTTSVGTVLATDADAGTSFSAWTITAGNIDGIFAINSTSGVITVLDKTNLDYETTTSYTLSLIVSDGINTSAAADVAIDVNNVNERPIAVVGEDQIVPENSFVVLDAKDSNDPEDDVLTYKWLAPEGIELSDINSEMPTFTAPEVNVLTDYIFTLVVNDGELFSEEVSVTVSVGNVTGIEDVNSDEFEVSLYPNPSSGSFYVNLNSYPLDYTMVRIINLSGKLVHSEKVYEKKNYFNLLLKAGMYIIEVEHENNRSVKKIIIR